METHITEMDIWLAWMVRSNSATPMLGPDASAELRDRLLAELSDLGSGGRPRLRIDYGPGYRVYFVRRGEGFVVLVADEGKCTQ